VSTTRVSGPRRAEVPFASEASLQRIIRRLCVRAGAPARAGEAVVERFVATEGIHLVAAFSPVAQPGTTATLRKCGPASQSLDDLVKAGVMSRAMASLLSSAVSGHLNLLVAAGSGTDARGLMSALLSLTRSGEHVVVFQDAGCHPALPRNATSILAANNADSIAAIRSAASLGADCVFVSALQGDVAAELLDAIGNGAEGVVAFTRAPSLRHAIARLVPDIAARRPGVPIEAVREAVSAAFDLYVELVRMRDGRMRVLRIAEPAGVEGMTIAQRDLFTFVAERTATGGTIEGSFHPAGVVPHAIADLQSRGVVVDPSLFRR
jgi:pilus assembly protein CpaF